MKKPIIFHPVLFAIFPSLFLFEANPSQFSLRVLLEPVAVTLAGTVLMWVLLQLLLKNRLKAALLVSLGLVISFSYGVTYALLIEAIVRIGRMTVAGQGLALLATAVPLVAATIWVVRTTRPLTYLTAMANITATVVCLFSVWHLASYTYHQRAAMRGRPVIQSVVEVRPAESRPNVYYIILDAYARSDVLRDVYRYDNHELIDFLRAKGFYIADESRSAYSQTHLSLTSTLNMDFIQNMVGQYSSPINDRRPLIDALRHNRLLTHLKRDGYSFVSFSTGIFATELTNADTYLSQPWFLNEFDSNVLMMTPVPAVFSQLGLPELYSLHRRRLLFEMDQVVKLSRRKGPQFVFAHLLIPHPPFIFGEDGQPVMPLRPFSIEDGENFKKQEGVGDQEYGQGYRAQAVFISKKIQTVIEKILANSATPPIIILQSDHGPAWLMNLQGTPGQNPCLRERFGILNAVFLPDRKYDGFYREISPINTVRLIVNKYFGGRYPMAPEESYFSTWEEPYHFYRVSSTAACDINGVQSARAGPNGF